jgi:hypothetical protein
MILEARRNMSDREFQDLIRRQCNPQNISYRIFSIGTKELQGPSFNVLFFIKKDATTTQFLG